MAVLILLFHFSQCSKDTFDMKTCSLDDLSKSLKIAAEKTQASIERIHTKGLSKFIETDDDGQHQAVVWQCCLPLASGEEHSYELLRIPWTDFVASEKAVVSEISLDFYCDVKQKRSKRDGLLDTCTLSPSNRPSTNNLHRRYSQGKNKNIAGKHHFKMVWRSDQDTLPVTTIDGKNLEESFLEHADKISFYARHRGKIFGAITIIALLTLSSMGLMWA